MATIEGLARARALAAIIAMTNVGRDDRAVAWFTDLVEQSKSKEDPTAPYEALTEFLLDILSSPESQTHRLRIIQQFVGASPVSRRQLLSRHAAKFVVFDRVTPHYRLQDVREWRTLCQYGDEELYVASAAAEAIVTNDGGVRDSLIGGVLSSWGVYIQPLDSDFHRVMRRGLHEAHVHLGELPPAPVLWRMLMTERYVPGITDPSWLCHGGELAKTIADRKLLLDWIGEEHVCRVNNDEFLTSSFTEDGEQSDCPGYIRRYLMVERVLLIRCLLGIPSSGRPGPLPTPELEEAFWRYTSARMRFFLSIVHPGRGFEAFARNRGLRYGADGQMFIACVQPAIGHLTDSHIRRVDVRFALREKFGQMTAQMGYVKNAIETLKADIRWNCIIAFSRGKAYKSDRRFGRRPGGWREEQRKLKADVESLLNRIASKSDRWPPEPFTILGIDMISSEYGFDPGIAAPAYALTCAGRVLSRQHLDWSKIPRLVRCYHTGEDREHRVTSARVTWEAINWLGLEAADRVSHLSYLADAPESYRVYEPIGERLDNLTWLFHLFRSGELTASSGLSGEWLALEIARVSDQIHDVMPARPTISDLIAAWKLRPAEETITVDPRNSRATWYFPEVTDVVRHAFLGYVGTHGLWSTEVRPPSNACQMTAEGIYDNRSLCSKMLTSKAVTPNVAPATITARSVSHPKLR